MITRANKVHVCIKFYVTVPKAVDSWPREDLCFSFLERSARLPDLTMNATLTSSSPLSLPSLFFSLPGFPLSLYHLRNQTLI